MKLQIRAIPGNTMVDFIPASSDRTDSSCFILIEEYVFFMYSFVMLLSTVLYTVHSFILIDVLMYNNIICLEIVFIVHICNDRGSYVSVWLRTVRTYVHVIIHACNIMIIL